MENDYQGAHKAQGESNFPQTFEELNFFLNNQYLTGQILDLSVHSPEIFEKFPDGIAVYTPDRKLVYRNEAARNLSAYLGESDGDNDYEFYDENNDVVPYNLLPVTQCLNEIKINQTEYLVVNKKNDRKIFLEISGIPVFENDKLSYAFIILHNIAKRRNAQLKVLNIVHELSIKNNQLLRNNQFNENVLGIISHDLRGPLTNMYSLIEMINITPEEIKKSEMLLLLKRMVQKQEQIVNSLAEIIEIQSLNKSKLEKIVIEDVINEIIRKNEIEIKNCGGSISYSLEKVPLFLYIKEYLVIVLQNIISNSINFRDTNKKLSISINGLMKEDYLLLIIKDNGIGIDMEKNGDRIFLPFMNKGDGKGLGLFLNKNIIEKNGGYFVVESEPQQGTCCYCFLKEYESPNEDTSPNNEL